MNKYLGFFLLLVCTSSFAAISKWVDSDGQVHYSDQPPPSDVRQKTLRADHGGEDSQSASSAAAPKTLAEREAELRKSALAKKEAADKAAQKQAAAAAQQANCTNAQQSLKALQSGIRMAEIGANGEAGYLDDNQRAQRVAKAQSDISTYCK